jgi:hypothetical protein
MADIYKEYGDFMASQGNPYRIDTKPVHVAPTLEEQLERRGKKRRKGKGKVAKDGAKRGSIEGMVFFVLTQLAVNYGASPEVSGLITPDNVGLLVGFSVLVMRVAEALIADGND